jgi:hypothetical protein
MILLRRENWIAQRLSAPPVDSISIEAFDFQFPVAEFVNSLELEIHVTLDDRFHDKHKYLRHKCFGDFSAIFQS